MEDVEAQIREAQEYLASWTRDDTATTRLRDMTMLAQHQRQRIAALEAQLNTRELAVERNGDPLREKFKELLDGLESTFLLAKSARIRGELDARLSTLVDTVRVLVRDNQRCFADNARYQAALEEAQRRVNGFVYDKNVSKRDLRQLYAHISFALNGGEE